MLQVCALMGVQNYSTLKNSSLDLQAYALTNNNMLDLGRSQACPEVPVDGHLHESKMQLKKQTAKCVVAGVRLLYYNW